MPVTDEPGIVCRVTADGDVICDPVFQSSDCNGSAMRVVSADEEVVNSIAPKAKHKSLSADMLPPGEWGPNKIELACRILEVLGQSDLPDSPNIPRRSGEIVDSVRQLLAPTPPSILLYNYSVLPANVMGAYYLNKADLVRMQQMFQIFSHPKQP